MEEVRAFRSAANGERDPALDGCDRKGSDRGEIHTVIPADGYGAGDAAGEDRMVETDPEDGVDDIYVTSEYLVDGSLGLGRRTRERGRDCCRFS